MWLLREEKSMNNEQREFLVTKIEKYNADIDKMNERIGQKTLLVGACGLAAVYSAVCLATSSNLSWYLPFLFLHGGFSIYHAKDVVTMITEKTGLKNHVREMEEQLDFEDVNSKGLSR